MKVIKDNYNKFPKELICEKCESLILLESTNDVHRCGESFICTWQCPCCGFENITDYPE